jgi:hypothetical protein
MSKTFFLLFALICSAFAFSQELEISESNYTFSVGNKPAVMLSIPFATKEQVEDALKSFMKDWGKHKTHKDEHTVLIGSSKAVGDKTFDAYAVITEKKGEQFSIQFGIDLGGAFLNKKDHPEQFAVWSKLLKDFGLKTVTSIINNELDAANQVQNKFISEQKQLENDIKDYQNDIEKMKKEIVDNEKERKSAKMTAGEEAGKSFTPTTADFRQSTAALVFYLNCASLTVHPIQYGAHHLRRSTLALLI